MNTKRVLELMQQDIQSKLTQCYKDEVAAFEKGLTDKLNAIFEQEMTAFKEKINSELSEKQASLIAKYLITLEMFEEPSQTKIEFIIKVKQ